MVTTRSAAARNKTDDHLMFEELVPSSGWSEDLNTHLLIIDLPEMEGITANSTIAKQVPVQSTPSSHLEKPEKFGGQDFKRWHQKMLFYLTTLNLARMVTETAPVVQEGENYQESVTALDAWKHSDFLCRNYILNSLENTLYSVFSMYKTSKELWQALKKKYRTEDAGKKKFIVGRFMGYKMMDSRSIVSQVEELQVIISEVLEEEGMLISEAFQVAAIIEKLPPSWKDYKSYLKHKHKEMTMDGLVMRLRIEEDNRNSDNGIMIGHSKAHMVESNNNGKGQERKFKGESSKSNQEVKKFNGKCFNCGKQGHRKNECRKPPKIEQANIA